MLDHTSRLRLHVQQSVAAKSIGVPLGTGRETDRLLAAWVDRLLPALGVELESSLNASPETSFAEAFASFSSGGRKQLQDLLGERGVEELLGLSQEADLEIFGGDYLDLARRQEKEGRAAVAASIYAIVAGDAPVAGSPGRVVFSEQIRRSARESLEVLGGGGPMGRRIGKFVEHFCKQVTDPAMLGGMMLASTVFQGARAFGLSRLLARPEVRWWTQGTGARLVASALGLGGEISTFEIGSKLIRQGMGEAQNWSPETLYREGLSFAISSALLKGFGVASQRGIEWIGARSSFTPTLLPALGGIGGIYLANRIEQGLGWRPKTDGADSLFEAVEFYVQSEVGGSLSRGLMGERWRRALQELELRSELAALRPGAGAPNAAGLAASIPGKLVAETAMTADFHGEPVFSSNPWGKRPIGPEQALMEQNGEAENAGTESLKSRLARCLMRNTQPRAPFQEHAQQVNRTVESFAATPNIDLGRYSKLLFANGVQDIILEDGQVMTRMEQLEIATRCFRHVMEINPLHRAGGSCYDHLVQVALERILDEGNVAPLDDLIRVVSIDRGKPDVEAFFRRHGWDERYQLRDVFRDNRLKQRSWFQPLNNLELGKSEKDAIAGFLSTYDRPTPARDSNGDPGLLSFEAASARRKFPDHLNHVDVLSRYLERWQDCRERLNLLRQAIISAAQSPLPLLYFNRVFKVLANGGVPWKLREISSPDVFDGRKLQGTLSFLQQDEYFSDTAILDMAAEHLNGGVYTGYIEDMGLARQYAVFYNHVPMLSEPSQQLRRMTEFRDKAQSLLDRKLAQGPNNFDPVDVLELLGVNPTPVANLAREAIEKAEVELEILDLDSLRTRWQSIDHRNREAQPPPSFYVPASSSPNGKPLIVIAELNPKLPKEHKIAQAILLPMRIVHEFRHYMQKLDFTDPEQRHIGETGAFLEDLFYLMYQGDLTKWNRIQQLLSRQGFGVYHSGQVDKISG